MVEQVHERVLAPQPRHAERDVLHGKGGGLAVDEVAVGQRVGEQGGDRVHVVFAGLADLKGGGVCVCGGCAAVGGGRHRKKKSAPARPSLAPPSAHVFKQEAQTLEHPVAHVELGHPVLVHERGQHGEGRARLRDDRDRDRRAHPVLALLHPQVVEQGDEHVLRPDGARDEAKGGDGGAADGLFVRAERVEQVEAHAHPLARRHRLRAPVRDAAHEVDARLQHLFVAVLEDGGEAREDVFDRRRHAVHAHDRDHGPQRPEDRPQHVGVLLPEVLVQDDAEVGQELVLAARGERRRDARDEVGRLLPHLGRLVVEAPLDGAHDLGEVRRGAGAEGRDDGAKPLEHDGRVGFRRLLERKEHAVDEHFLQAGIDVRRALGGEHAVDGVDDHAAVGFGFVLQIFHDAAHDGRDADAGGKSRRRVDDRSVVAAVEGHAAHPKVLEKVGRDVGRDVRRRHAIRRDAARDDG
jgi:hypothetical protein